MLPVLPTRLVAVITPLMFWLISPAEFRVTVPTLASVTYPFKMMLLPEVVVVRVILEPVTEPECGDVPSIVIDPVLLMLASPALLVVTTPVTVRPLL